MTNLPPFRVATSNFDAITIDAPPSPAQFTFTITDYVPDATIDPPPSSLDPSVGSFQWDLDHNYNLRWPSFEAMTAWMQAECLDKSIEFIKKQSPPPLPGNTMWLETHIFVCSRQGSGGRSAYQPKHNWNRKIESKRTGCPCRLTVKVYPGTLEVLGFYKEEHSHATGDANLKYMRLDVGTRREIERYLRMGMEPKKILELITCNMYREDNLADLRGNQSHRRDFVTRADIRRIQKVIEEETIRLAAGDGASVLQWVDNLRKAGHFVFLKRTDGPAPPESNLDPQCFVLIIQTKYQLECWEEFGPHFAGIDGTHNTTHYENMTLFTLLVRDRWGHGMPAAWMVSSNGKEITVDFFLLQILSRSPSISPFIFMTDFDWAQINSIRRRFPRSLVLLCWWHVLHAWQQHFVTQHYELLWEKMKSWIRITDQVEFDVRWAEIKALAPPSVVEYLESYWMKEVRLWSAVYRVDRTIFDLGDTNMLVEAWHHLLKGDFLEGKRNRRLDHLIHALYDIAMPHFIARHHRQALGFEGPDLALKHRTDVIQRAASISRESIQFDPQSRKYIIRSQSDPENIFYEVDLDAYDCTCLSFPLIRFCKHICAIQRHFPEEEMRVPVAALDVRKQPSDNSDAEEVVDRENSEEITQAERDQQSLDDLTRRLNSLMLSCATPPPVMTDKLREAILNATKTLDGLAIDLEPAAAILPLKKARIAPNQHSWSETSAVMQIGVVKSKKRSKHSDPYSGKERSGKKAKPDAQEPLTASVSILAPVASSSNANTEPSTTSHYRPRPNISPVTPSESTVVLASSKKHNLPAAFDAETFDLADTVALKRLNNPQLRSLCLKYDIDTARRNEDMVKNIEDFHRTRQRQQNVVPMPLSYPTYAAFYHPLMYYQQAPR